jgi:hypothetical protein
MEHSMSETVESLPDLFYHCALYLREAGLLTAMKECLKGLTNKLSSFA